MDHVLAGLPAFIVYFAAGAALLALCGALYVRFTPYDEMALIRDGNVAAMLSLAGVLIGFAIPLSRCIAQASSMVDLALWALAAFVVQVLCHLFVRWLVPDLPQRVQRGELSTAGFAAAVSLAAGLINSAAMTL